MAARITASCHSSGTVRVRTHSRQAVTVSSRMRLRVDSSSASKPSSGPRKKPSSFSRRKVRPETTWLTGQLVVRRKVTSEHRKRTWLEPEVLSASRAPQSAAGFSRTRAAVVPLRGRTMRTKAVGR